VGDIDDVKIAKEKSNLFLSLFMKNNTMKSQKSNLTGKRRAMSVSDDASMFTEYLAPPPIKEEDIHLEESSPFETRDDIAAFILDDGETDVVIRGLRDIKIQQEEEQEDEVCLDDLESNWKELHRFSTRLISSVMLVLRKLQIL